MDIAQRIFKYEFIWGILFLMDLKEYFLSRQRIAENGKLKVLVYSCPNIALSFPPLICVRNKKHHRGKSERASHKLYY